MPIQQGPDPTPSFRVRWKGFGGWGEPVGTISAPRVEEGVLVLQTSPTRMLWIPLHTITGPIEVEGV
ncbi:hypothetical protein [Streptomyces antibioticus]|uniref:hypothetical protein n=1 Tax=Streptomyces antibioticus TaxID=1890 RepID=UPI003D731569